MHKLHIVAHKSMVKNRLKFPSETNIEVIRRISRDLSRLKYKLLRGAKTNKTVPLHNSETNSKIHFQVKVTRNIFWFIVINYMPCYLLSDSRLWESEIKWEWIGLSYLALEVLVIVLNKVSVVICLLSLMNKVVQYNHYT